MRAFCTTKLSDIAFLLLFAMELTFYLLILQTGIVEYYHSDMSQIWMIPVGGILGIITSIFVHKQRVWLIPIVLFLQLLLSLDYANANSIELFLLGVISGLTAPMLIARIDKFSIAVIALALSYTYGTYYFDTPAQERTQIALFLSLVAFVSSLFAQMQNLKKSTLYPTLFSVGSIFLWLLLDAALFETLSRDSMMHLWGESRFTWNIILFHIIGLVVAYKALESKHNNTILLLLFTLSYTLYTLEWQWGLSIIYPFVISYYNVIILRKLSRLPYPFLAVMALSLWGASGLGLLVALGENFMVAWIVLILLAIIEVVKMSNNTLYKTVEDLFSIIKEEFILYLQNVK